MPIQDYPIYQNVSLDDFKQKFQSLTRLDDKFDFIYDYLLSYGLGEEEPECSMEELLHLAKTEFVASSLALKEEYKKAHPSVELGPDVINPYGGTSAEDEAMMKVFLADPTRFLAEMGNSFGQSIKEDPSLPEAEQDLLRKWKENCLSIGEKMKNQKDLFEAYENDVIPEEITAKVSQKLFGRDDVGAAELLDRNKGGIFERLSGTTSGEYKAFKRAFQEYNDVDHPNFGDMENLESTAMGYLRHKFPNLEEGKLPTPEQIAAIKNTTSKGRIAFAVSVVEEIAAQKKIEEAVNAFADLNLDQPDPEQQEFQQGLAEDVAENDNYAVEVQGNEEELQVEVGLEQ